MTRWLSAERYGSLVGVSLAKEGVFSAIRNQVTKGDTNLGPMGIYTRKGDDGTTGLLFGGRVRKDADPIEVNGAVDEAQAALGLARAHGYRDAELNEILMDLERDLYVLMAEVATLPENRSKLSAGTSLVTKEMVDKLETLIDSLSERFAMPTEFVIPGQNIVSASLDVARTNVRRAERLSVSYKLDDSLVTPYLNRLSDLVWTMARWQEGDDHVLAKGES
jgi:cob(I)alamin adenosyltransferase